MSIKIIRRQGEPVGNMVRRLKRMMERTGVVKELRKRQHYEKPSEKRRKKAERKKFQIKKGPQSEHKVGEISYGIHQGY
jgi:small subunit ribosomal protein S21